MTDDLISFGCGYYLGRVLFWGGIMLVGLVFMNPWLLLIPLGIWILVVKYGGSDSAPAGSGGSVAIVAAASPAGPNNPQDGTGRALDMRPRLSGDGRPSELGHPVPGGDGLVCLTWNLGRRTHTGHTEQIRRANADIVALQEVSAKRHPSLARELADQGLLHQYGGPSTARTFPFASMIVSRWPIRDAAADGLEVPFPERVQVAIVATPFGDVEVLNVHVPAATSSGVEVKVATFEGISRYLAQPSAIPRIMVGDFNTPKAEAGGHTSYWGTAHQQGAERAVIEGHATTGLHDAFRHVNGAHADAASWRASNQVPRRYDHVFASQDLVPVEATYGDLEQIKLDNMSDHAPLWVVFRSTSDATERSTPLLEVQSQTRVLGEQPKPIASPNARVSRKEPAMATPNEIDLHTFLKSLSYRVDERNDPDDARRRQFRMGWQRAVQGKDMAASTLAKSLTWNNLGFRAGKLLGSQSYASVDATFDDLAAIYRREKTG